MTPDDKRRTLLRAAAGRILLAARLLDRRVSDPRWEGDPAPVLLRAKAVEAGLRVALCEAEGRQP
jgi:hypothetical protein